MLNAFRRPLVALGAVLSCAIGIAIPAGPARDGSTSESASSGAGTVPRRFRADGANHQLVVSTGSGLDWSFDRGTTDTIDPDGSAVDSDDPRADRLVHIAAVPAPVDGGK